MSSVVSWIIILGTLGSLLVFFLILHLNRRISRPGETTGHNYDGIEEYDNPLPAWWYWGFLISIIFGVGYLLYYPGLGNFPGLSGWTQLSQLEEDMLEADEKYGPIFAQFRAMPLDELMRNEEAVNMGRRLFANNCAVCHGATAQGSLGFPNLTDEEWLWGEDAVETSILGGRKAVMIAWQNSLGEDGVQEVAEYVMSLAGREVDAALAEQGRIRYSTFCIACHGPEGKGQPLLGAPNLSNDIWLYGGRREDIVDVISHGRNGEMPAFRDKLGEDKVHILAAYVKSLSAGR